MCPGIGSFFRSGKEKKKLGMDNDRRPWMVLSERQPQGRTTANQQKGRASAENSKESARVLVTGKH